MEPIQTEVVVIGGGPGGYAAAFYAADLGKKVAVLIWIIIQTKLMKGQDLTG